MLTWFATAFNSAGTANGSDSYKDLGLTGLAAGDLVVVFATAENFTNPAGTRSISTQSGALSSWTAAEPAVSSNADTDFVMAWATVTSGSTATVRGQVRASTSNWMGVGAWVIPAGEWDSGTSPTFTTAVADTDAQWSVSVADSSFVLFALGDYVATDLGSSNTPAGASNDLTFNDDNHYASVARSWTAQAPGTRAYGPSGASGRDVSGAAAVVKSSGGGGGPSPISLREAGTPTSATAAVTAINPSVPSGATTGDLSVLTVWMKPYSTTITTPSGWTKVDEATNGTTASGTDTGSTKVAVFVRESAPVGAIGNITFSGANSCGAVINTYARDATYQWDVSAFTTGGDTSNGANYSATGAAGIDVAEGDWVAQGTAVNGDVGTQSARTIAGMSGATLGTYVVRQSADVTTGNDSHGEVGDIPITAGSSDAAPTFTYTNSSSGSGTTLWLRLRQTSPQANLSGTVTAVSALTGAPTAVHPLAGQIAASSALTGAPTAVHPLAGTVAATSGAAGAPTVGIPLAGTVAAASTVAGAITVAPGLAGTVAAVSSTAGSPTAVHPLAGVTAATSTVTGTPAASHSLAGTVAASSSATGAPTVAVGLAGTTAATSATSGSPMLAATLAGSIPATSGTIGDPAAQHPLAGTVAAVTTTSGTLAPAGMSGTVTAVSALTGAPTAVHPLAGTVAATSTLIGAPAAAHPLAGTIPAATAAVGAPASRRWLAGSIAASAGVAGAPAADYRLSGVVAAVSGVAAVFRPSAAGGRAAGYIPATSTATSHDHPRRAAGYIPATSTATSHDHPRRAAGYIPATSTATSGP